jgi:hypothetical protein
VPIEGKDDDEKDNFYEDLDQIYEKCQKRDLKIIIGDLNPKNRPRRDVQTYY